MEMPVKSLQKKISIRNIDFKESFGQLCEEEKNYLYCISKACWTGQIIVLFQTSYESPALFIIFQTFFKSFKSMKELNDIVKQKKIDPVIFSKFIEYAANFYSNFGNYTLQKKKFFPEFPKNEKNENQGIEYFTKILELSPKYQESIQSIWEIIKYIVFDESEDSKKIDLEEKEGKNCYYFGGIKKEQIQSIDNYLLSQNIYLTNTRLFKLNTKTVVLIGSADEKQIDLTEENILLYGEYSSILKKIIKFLTQAQNFTSKSEEKDLLSHYINFFQTGDVQHHIEAQKKWLELNSNIIDYNMGWIETLIDPMEVRGVFESFVGFIDTFMSQKYEQLINILPDLMLELPWKNEFNEINNNINFKAFEVICYARKGCPYGKSLPNYSDIRKTLGVKDLLFSNVMPNFKELEDNFFFFDSKDKELINNFGQSSIKITTSIRLILGYGVAKFLKCEKNLENDEETYNFEKSLINPLTGKEIEEWYKDDENYEKKFGKYSNLVNDIISLIMGLYFCGNENIQEIFYINKIDFKNVTYTCWMLFLSNAIQDLNLYNQKEKIWRYSTPQCAWIIINYILAEQKESEEIIKIQFDEDKTSFKIILNKDSLPDTVNEIISKLLQTLYISKCIGNAENVIKIIDKYSVMEKECILDMKKIIDKDEDNKTFYLFQNLVREKEDNEGKVEYKEYENNLEGIIQSCLDRYDDEINKDIYNQWVKYATNFIKTK